MKAGGDVFVLSLLLLVHDSLCTSHMSCTRTTDGEEVCRKKDLTVEEEDATDDNEDDGPVFVDNLREPLYQWDPVEVGHERQIEVEPGKHVTMKTLAMKPKLFVIPDFLSAEECEQIISIAEETGMFQSELHLDNHYRAWKATNYGSASTVFGEFSNYDTDDDDDIDMQEIITLVQHSYLLFFNSTDVEKMLSAADITAMSDGVITKEEFESVNTKGMEEYIKHIREHDPIFRDRFSQQVWLNGKHMLQKNGGSSSDTTKMSDLNVLMKRLRERLMRLTRLPRYIIEGSEPLQVLRYAPNGHYHAHHDGQHLTKEGHANMSCCHFDDTGDGRKCKLCRFVTVGYYLNDVEEGGETAFPVADEEDFDIETLQSHRWETDRYNLVKFCHNASVRIAPKRGSAILWYNYHLNEDGWMGPLDTYSLHGGCEVKKGEKWFANNWIPAPPSGSEHLDSILNFYN